jgi:heme-degrading monooxygenase HmoA
MTETYTHGRWTVKSGQEDAFVQEWTSFVTWASTLPGSGTFRLTRDLDNPGDFVSFAPWETSQAQDEWRQQPEFMERLARVRIHCDAFQAFTLELVTTVE